MRTITGDITALHFGRKHFKVELYIERRFLSFDVDSIPAGRLLELFEAKAPVTATVEFSLDDDLEPRRRIVALERAA